MSVRILGGALRGRVLASSPAGVRPTGARQREALFAIWGASVYRARVLDLFAGSGIIAFEAISRGARSALLIDAGARVVQRLRASDARLRTGAGDLGTVRIRRGRLPGCLRTWPASPFDLIFADPPYAFTDWPTLIGDAGSWLAPGGEVAIEHSARTETPESVSSLERFDRRTWGETAISRYRRAGEGPVDSPAA